MGPKSKEADCPIELCKCSPLYAFMTPLTVRIRSHRPYVASGQGETVQTELSTCLSSM